MGVALPEGTRMLIPWTPQESAGLYLIDYQMCFLEGKTGLSVFDTPGVLLYYSLTRPEIARRSKLR